MRVLVVYDSYFHNTEKIAKAFIHDHTTKSQVEVIKVQDITADALKGIDLLVVGSPTRAFKPTPDMVHFLKGIPAGGLKGMKAVAFDTRVSTDDMKSKLLGTLVKTFGYAAEPLDKLLRQKGARVVSLPQAFVVKDKEGPLKPGEIERARDWAKSLLESE
ncbi:MAG: nitric oxide synthase [Clostridia bacterium]